MAAMALLSMEDPASPAKEDCDCGGRFLARGSKPLAVELGFIWCVLDKGGSDGTLLCDSVGLSTTCSSRGVLMSEYVSEPGEPGVVASSRISSGVTGTESEPLMAGDSTGSGAR